jgi:hypothetical protein
MNLTNQVKTFINWIVAGLIDAVFLILWVSMQRIANIFVDSVELTSVDALIRDIFIVLFSVSTLTPVLLFIYKDIMIMVIRTYRSIESEIRRGGGS